jgi:hypothetical protein
MAAAYPLASFLPVISAIEMISMAGISGAGEWTQCSIYVAASLPDQLFTFLGMGTSWLTTPGAAQGSTK